MAKEKSRRAKADANKPHSRARGYTRAWERFRKWYLAQNPICEWPECYRPAKEVDHIIPLSWGGSHCDEANSQALCKSHHGEKTRREMGFFGVKPWLAVPKNLRPAGVPLTIVCGPPGSGKSYYVKNHAAKSDTVIDLDLILSELSGQPEHCVNDKWLEVATQERNKRLANLHQCKSQQAWFIVSAASPALRDRWEQALRPIRVIVLLTDKKTCLARLAKRETHIDYATIVERWYEQFAPRPNDHLIYWGRDKHGFAA